VEHGRVHSQGNRDELSADGRDYAVVAEPEDEDARDYRLLAEILIGERGGDAVLKLPWVRKPSELVEVRTSSIRIEHGPDGYELHVGAAVALTATRPVATTAVVALETPLVTRPPCASIDRTISASEVVSGF
jgi:hypothetical protein